MINDLFTAAEQLIIGCTNPDVTSRMAQSSSGVAVENKFLRDYYYESGDDVVEYLPFWVLRLKQSAWFLNSPDGMKASTVIEAAYFEAAKQYEDVPNIQTQHRLSAIYFGAFFYGVWEDVSERQNRGSTFQCSQISISEAPKRTPITGRDEDKPDTDFWQGAFDFHIGDGQG